MNCNKCGTPILPGESVCRFCGTIGDFSIRKEKPEIIGFDIEDNYERIEFTLGEDDISIDPTEKEQPVVINLDETWGSDDKEPVSLNTNLTEVSTVEEKVLVNDSNNNDLKMPFVKADEVSLEPNKELVKPMLNDAISKVEEIKVPLVNSVIDEPPTAKIPVDEVKKIVESEMETENFEEVITSSDNEIKKEEVTNEIKEEKNKEVKEKTKKTSSYKVICIVLVILLIASIALNCLLLIQRSDNSGIVKASESSLVNLKTVYKNYKFSLPYSWTVNGDNSEFLLIHDEKETWAASISLATDLEYDFVSTNVETINNVFSKNNHAFTSNYTKTLNGKEFQIFKGKYYSHTVYLMISQLDEETTAIVEVKFKGEVNDEIINDIMKCLTSVSSVDMEKFSENEFKFEDVTPLLDGIISKVEEEE